MPHGRPRRGIKRDMANRHQRRRHSALFRRSKIESVPRKVETVLSQRKGERYFEFLERVAAHGEVQPPTSTPCDWPGCGADWQFATHATVGKVRKVIARRCTEHRLSS